MNEITPFKDAASPARLVYVLYLLSLFIGLTWLVGLVIAYVCKDDAPDLVKTHYVFQIRTFWIGLIMLIVGIPLCLIVIGWALVAFWYLWTIVRCIKGLKYLMNNQVHPKPAAWGFG
jgi:uncharacterized membrane protein